MFPSHFSQKKKKKAKPKLQKLYFHASTCINCEFLLIKNILKNTLTLKTLKILFNT